MHVYFGLRGLVNKTEMFKMFLQTQMWKWDVKTLDVCECGKKKEEHKKIKSCKGYNKKLTKGFKPGTIKCQVQGALRECFFLYEYIIPEECLNELLSCLDLTSHHENLSGLKAWAIRKMLGHGVKPIPKNWKKVPTNKFIEQTGIALYLIGIKYDKRAEMETWRLKQELL